jgi:hypothetical protein
MVGNANPEKRGLRFLIRFAVAFFCGPTSMDALHRGFVNTGFHDSLSGAFALPVAGLVNAAG